MYTVSMPMRDVEDQLRDMQARLEEHERALSSIQDEASALEVQAEAMSREYDRARDAFYRTYDLANIALILANALLGFLFLASGDAGLREMTKVAFEQDEPIGLWISYPVILSIIWLLLSIWMLLQQVFRKPRFVSIDGDMPSTEVVTTRMEALIEQITRCGKLAMCYRVATDQRTVEMRWAGVLIFLAILCYVFARLATVVLSQ